MITPSPFDAERIRKTGLAAPDVARRIEVLETNIERRGDGSRDHPHRRVAQYWSLDGQLLAERDDLAPTHCNAIGHRVMPGTAGCDHCGATLAEMVRKSAPTVDPTCSCCSTPLPFSARQRGAGRCGPCSRVASGTQGLADRARAAGVEPSLVLEILRSPEGRAAITECVRRPPIRMPDGAWREATPGRIAKVGDAVRFTKSGEFAGDVFGFEGSDTLWARYGDRGRKVAMDEVEVYWPASVDRRSARSRVTAESTPSAAAAPVPGDSED